MDCFKKDLNLYPFLHLDEEWYSFLKERHCVTGEKLLNDGETPSCLGQSCKDPQDNASKILYHRHDIKDNNLIESINPKKVDGELQENAKDNDEKWFFVEVYEARSNMGTTWETCPENEDHRKLYEREFTSAALVKIVILDERIQSDVGRYRTLCEEDNSPKVIDPQWILAKEKNRVFVPSIKECGSLYEPKWKGIKKYLAGISDDPIDCIVIHLGVLQNLKKEAEGEKDERYFLDVLAGINNHENLYLGKLPPLSVRVCTGRGNIRGSADGRIGEIIPFAELKKWLSPSSPSKYHLYRLLDL